jgi:hypothetical protein
MSLSSTIVRKVSSQIHKQYPEMKGVSPGIQEQRSPANKKDGAIYLLKYETTVKSAGGKNIKRWVRVTVNENGKILRTSTSR